MSNTNQFPGLARGPIDHNASSVINVIADTAIGMGSPVALKTGTVSAELLPRVEELTSQVITSPIYGIAVGGDADGIYGDGGDVTSDINRAATAAGQGVVIVTQGRCLAKVKGAVVVGDRLGPSTTEGALEKANGTNLVMARALQAVGAGNFDMIAVDVQREGSES